MRYIGKEMNLALIHFLLFFMFQQFDSPRTLTLGAQFDVSVYPPCDQKNKDRIEKFCPYRQPKRLLYGDR